MEERSIGPAKSNTLVFFVLGALVVAVAGLAFFALGGQFGGSGTPAQPVVVTPVPVPTPVPTPVPVPTPQPNHRDDHNDRDRNDRNDRDRH